MTAHRGFRGAARAVVVALSFVGASALAQTPDLPAAPKAAPQDSGALRVKVQGTLTDAQKNDPKLEDKTKIVASELRCPVCQGLSIQDSPSELSQQMRTVVKEQLASGKSEQEVKDYFISKYGEWILLEPPPHGFNLFIYALPAALILGGAGLIVLLVRRWTTAGATASATTGAGSDDNE